METKTVVRNLKILTVLVGAWLTCFHPDLKVIMYVRSGEVLIINLAGVLLVCVGLLWPTM